MHQAFPDHFMQRSRAYRRLSLTIVAIPLGVVLIAMTFKLMAKAAWRELCNRWLGAPGQELRRALREAWHKP
jgi:hypothetical protein